MLALRLKFAKDTFHTENFVETRVCMLHVTLVLIFSCVFYSACCTYFDVLLVKLWNCSIRVLGVFFFTVNTCFDVSVRKSVELLTNSGNILYPTYKYQ